MLQAQGKTIAIAYKEAGTTEQSYYRWRNKYGGLGVDQANCCHLCAFESNPLLPPVQTL